MHSVEALFFFLVGLGAFAAAFGGIVLGVIAFLRTRQLTKRIETLERAQRRSPLHPREPVAPVAQSTAPPPPVAPPMPIVPRPVAPTTPPIATAEPATPVASRWGSDAKLPPPTPPIDDSLHPHVASERAAFEAASPEPAAASRTAAPMDAPRDARRGHAPLERVIGVTGAAILGGIVLAIAGFYFYEYSVEKGLITPTVRVVLGTLVGIAAIGASDVLRQRGYRITSDALAGGGIAVLYAAFWAAHAIFDLWSFWWSFLAMGGVTALCCALALRHSSQLVALLGLMGGFATPIALSSGQDRPIGLFGWTLLVNFGFLSIAHKQRWPMLGVVGMLGTFAIEALWVAARMRPETFPVALVSLGVFSVLFTIFVALQPNAERARWRVSQLGAVFLPLVFCVYFAQSDRTIVGDHVYPIALLAALVCAAASWLARDPALALVPLGAASGSVALLGVWVVTRELDVAAAWELVACAAGLTGVLHASLWLRSMKPPVRERDEAPNALDERWLSVVLATGGVALVVTIASSMHDRIAWWPWIAGWAWTSLLMLRQAAVARWHALSIVAAVLAGFGMLTSREHFGPASYAPSEVVAALVVAGFVVAFQLAASAFRDERARRFAWWAAGVSALFAIGTVATDHPLATRDARFALAAVLAFGAGVAFAAERARSSLLFALGAVAAVSAQVVRAEHAGTFVASARVPFTELFVIAATACVFSWAPAVRRTSWAESRWVWRISATASVIWFFQLREGWTACFTDRALGALPLALAAIAGVGLLLLRGGVAEESASDRKRPAPLELARTWFAALALFWLSFALPLQLDRSWPFVGLAFAGASLAWLWTRRDHAPLQVVSVCMLVMATFALIATRLGGTYSVYPDRLVNWLAWEYFVPAAAAALASTSFARGAASRDRVAGERSIDSGARVCAAIAGSCAALLFFVWLNLVILNAFGTVPRIAWPSVRMPARDLTMSLAWALYALALLVLGVGRKLGAARWLSLALLVLTIAKVFLFDLGNLQGLYRVASLLGLAVALLSVSLLYQRFVFRPARRAA